MIFIGIIFVVSGVVFWGVFVLPLSPLTGDPSVHIIYFAFVSEVVVQDVFCYPCPLYLGVVLFVWCLSESYLLHRRSSSRAFFLPLDISLLSFMVGCFARALLFNVFECSITQQFNKIKNSKNINPSAKNPNAN